MHKYRLISKKGEGTFSEVLKAQCIKNGRYVAIKCMKSHFDSLEHVNNLREVQALRRLSPHANIVKLIEVLYDQPTGRLALVFELMDMNIYDLIRGRRHYVAEDRIKNYMYQLIKAMDHMHRNGIFHRDIKPENILITEDALKLADFGSCRGIYSKQPYTEYISTRWYRAPECLLTDGYYNYKMDMWGVGCVFFELVALFPLFPGTNELDQIHKTHNITGTPSPEVLAKIKRRSTARHMNFNFPPKVGSGIAKLIPHFAREGIDLIERTLAYNPDDRLSAQQALRHPYFRELRERDKIASEAFRALPDMRLKTPPAQSHSDYSDNFKGAGVGAGVGAGSSAHGALAAGKGTAADLQLPLIGKQPEKAVASGAQSQQQPLQEERSYQSLSKENSLTSVYNVELRKVDSKSRVFDDDEHHHGAPSSHAGFVGRSNRGPYKTTHPAVPKQSQRSTWASNKPEAKEKEKKDHRRGGRYRKTHQYARAVHGKGQQGGGGGGGGGGGAGPSRPAQGFRANNA